MPFLVIFAYILTFFTHYRLRTDDLNVYIPYITNILDGRRLGAQYDYQVFYWVLGLLNKAFYHFFPNADILPMGLIVTASAFVLFIFIYLTFFFIKKVIKVIDYKNHKYLIILVVIYTLSQFWYIAYPSYGNTFRRLSVVWILIALMFHIIKPSWKNIYLMAFFFLTLVNFSSTGIFLSFFLLYALSHVFAYINEDEMWNKLWILSVPFSIWATLFNSKYFYIILFFHIVLFVLNITKQIHKFENLWKKYHTYILVGVPILFFLLANIFPNQFGYILPATSTKLPRINFFSNPEYEMLINYLRFDFSSLRFGFLSVVNIVLWFSIVFSIINIKKIENKVYKSLIYLILVLLITFFNPFVSRFVITNLTSIAYFRIYDIFFNPIMILIYFITTLSLIKNTKIKLFVKILLMFSLVLGTIFSDLWPYLDFRESLDHIHHVNKNEIEVLKQLEDYVHIENINEPVNIIVQINAAHILTDMQIVRQTSQRIDNLALLYESDSISAKLNQIFYVKTYEFQLGSYHPPFTETCTLTKEVGTQFVIVEAQYNWDVENGLGYCAEKIFEVGDYRVFRMRYEWLDN